MIKANVYVVRAEVEVVVVANDEDDAVRIAKANLHQESQNMQLDAEFVRRPSQVPKEWLGALAYGTESLPFPQPTVMELVDARHEEFCSDPHCERCAHLGGFASEVTP